MGAYDLLAVTKLRGIWNELKDIRSVSSDLRWTKGTDGRLGNVTPSASGRIPLVNATHGEIFARISDRVTIAPLVNYNQAAPLKTQNVTVRLEQSTIPKIKHGTKLDEEMLNVLARIENSLSGVEALNSEDANTFLQYEINQLDNLADGVDWRIEQMAISMLVDSFVYNAGGVNYSITWNTPAEFKLTPSTLWGDGTAGISHGAATATPFSDIWTLMTNLQQKYGVTYNRMSMSYQTFQYILNTTEFKNLAPIYLARFGFAPTVSQLPFNDTALMKQFVTSMFSGQMEIEFDDRVVMQELPDLSNWVAPPGTPAATQYVRLMPANKVILSNVQNDGDRRIWDIANAPVIEALPGMIPGLIGGSTGDATGNGRYGPFPYASAASLNANPPGKELWVVQDAIPRKKALDANAVLTVW